ncbi:MAG: MFS transporter [Candidatus Sumerlaeota bacterium]|nr:MFS transporter [Candidatus Sumerlaeota bacterium]
MSALSNSLGDIGSPARKFLLFVSINVISWQCLVGPAQVIFARQIGMPPSWIGWLQSFTPLCGVLILFTVPMVERLGPKRLLLWTWFGRSSAAAVIFLAPAAVALWGPRGAWYVLILAAFGFCLVRGLGMGGWFPWLHENVPGSRRGLYFSLETIISNVGSILWAFAVGAYLHDGATLEKFLWIYGFGILAGFMCLWLIWKIPGGRQAHLPARTLKSSAAYLRALRDKPFAIYCVKSSAGLVCLSFLGAANILYLKEEIKMPPDLIMYASAAGSLAIALTIRSWGHFADRNGGPRSMFLTLTGHSLAAIGWLTLIPGTLWSQWAVWPVFVLGCVFSAAFCMALNREMLCLIREENRVAYSNLFVIMNSLAAGVTPIFVGWMIDAWGLRGFQLCFALAVGCGLVCAVWCRMSPRELRQHVAYSGAMILTQTPLRTLARIFWVTIGLDDDETRK